MAHPNFLLNNRVLLVGGSSGLGFATASAALSNKSKVHITSTTPEKLATKIGELQSLYSGAHVSGSVANLANADTLEESLQSVLEAAVKELGGIIDHIVWTAGDERTLVPLAQMTAVSAMNSFTLRYVGPLLVGKLIAANSGKYVKTAASSSITLTSGIMAHRPRKGIVAGTAGAVEAIMRSLAVELAPIRVNAVIPGAVMTELLQRMFAGNPALAESMEGAFKTASLTQEVGTPEAAAEAYLFCMRSALATGQSFVIDNGYLMSSGGM
ncbi:NAD(P)-binding protein [Favolaschia claudopus]|uniref:NAD(P)-binding protein n=1 Tax=Favolaschia claudopus TaxID=2862362 RepID=A0AAW0BG63_9AGAR